MSRSTKDAWLEGPGDLKEADVEDVPVKGQSVRVRGLPSAYSRQAASDAAKMVTDARGEQALTIDQAKMVVLQFAHGCVDPTFTVEEATAISEKYGPAFEKVIEKIDELSGVDKEALEKTQATFPAVERSANGSSEAVADEPSAVGS